MASFILIHGAFQGAWVWRAVADILAGQGHAVITPGLTGLGDRSHLLKQGVGLADYVDDVVNAACFAQAGPSVFVGHSFSGLVAAAAAARLAPLACGLAYVDAIIPEHGRSFQEMGGPEFAKVIAAHAHDGWLVRPWPLGVFGVVEPELAPGFASRLTSMPLAAFTDVYDFELPGKSIPKAFIRCVRNPNPLIAAQGAKAKTAGLNYREIDAHHAPMVTAPAALAQALLDAAESMPATGTVPEGYHAGRMLRTPPARPGSLGGDRP